VVALGEFTRGRWERVAKPFEHFRAADVLRERTYAAVASGFNDILDATEGGNGPYKLQKGTKNYDARMLAVNADIAPMFWPLFDVDWIRWLYGLCEIPFVPKIDAALHSSPPDSQSGWIHTDLCSAWFDEDAECAQNGLMFADRNRCDYFSGKPTPLACRPIEYVRAATVIYYLCNDHWSSGDGGETALYASKGKNSPYSLVAPFNNTVLVFKCSPHSYHRFIANRRSARNSVIFWLHSTVDYALSQWGTAINRPQPK
jgi:2OG-Fe(II) oxygenase superfamily